MILFNSQESTDDTDGTDDATTAATDAPATTTTEAATGCVYPGWANDDYCDDENNTAECNWDGGACCNNDGEFFDYFCTECACLDPAAATTTTAAPCEDIWSATVCENRKNKGKCTKTNVAANCQLTCELC